MASTSHVDRITGCLLAGALGDAIGAHFEGKPGTTFALPSDLRVTDDTQLTIATCESIIETNSVNPESMAAHFVRWFRERRIRGIGASTLKSLTELNVGGHWALVGASGEYSAGNGAAMRIAPLAFCLDPDKEADRQKIRDVCRITHRNDEAYIGALVVVRSIRHAIDGKPLDGELLMALVDSIPDCRVRDRLAEVCDSVPTIAEYNARFDSSGYVVDSVPLAVLAAIQSTDLLATIRQIVSCGGDTDTIASMYGQIYGASRGTQALPAEVVEHIDEYALVRDTAKQFSRQFVVS